SAPAAEPRHAEPLLELDLLSDTDPSGGDEMEGLDIDVEMTPTPPPLQDETTPASLAEAFQVLESAPQSLDDAQTTDRYDISDQFEGGAGQRCKPTLGALVPPEALRAASAASGSPEREATSFGPPDETGDLAEVTTTRIFTRLAAMRETGLLRVECGGAVKDIYLSGGAPEYVTSNLARELLGEYLVAQGVITSGELSMALAMRPRFGGKLGDTLVGLSRLR